MKQHIPPERRTYLQDRFEILIKRQKEGTATFNELTELDWIVNADPKIREIIIREMEGFDDTNGQSVSEEMELEQQKVRQRLWSKIGSLFRNILLTNKRLSLFERSVILTF